ncbi:MAG: hypothetical protein U5R06_02555 [candidate division KSB1 bacterium]|nr:hypothetical protein [candidate division KSB1 bacterium]
MNRAFRILIYFKDIKFRYTRINAAMGTKLQLSSPGDAVEKTDFDLFPEFQAEKKRAQKTSRKLLKPETLSSTNLESSA